MRRIGAGIPAVEVHIGRAGRGQCQIVDSVSSNQRCHIDTGIVVRCNTPRGADQGANGGRIGIRDRSLSPVLTAHLFYLVAGGRTSSSEQPQGGFRDRPAQIANIETEIRMNIWRSICFQCGRCTEVCCCRTCGHIRIGDGGKGVGRCTGRRRGCRSGKSRMIRRAIEGIYPI